MRIISCVSGFWLSVLLALNVTALKWSPTPTDGEVLYACTNSEVTIAWNYAVQEGDIISIVWNFHGRSQEMVAVYAQGNFIPLPSFSERVRFVPNAGITLSHLRKADAGNYSVTVIGHDGTGASIEIHRSVFLQVSEALMTTDHELHADQATAEFYNVTQQYHAVLTCGQFTFSVDPPISVEWLTPKGETLASTLYSKGLFKLYIPNPVTAGNYTCRISATSVNRSCSHGQGQAASVEVSGVMTRLTLMEARLAEKDAIIDQLNSTQHKLLSEQAEKNAVIDQLNSTQHKLLSEQAEKNAIIDQLNSTQHKLLSEQAEKDAIIDQLNRTQNKLVSEQAEKSAIIDQLNRTQNKLVSEQAEKDAIIDQLNRTQTKLVSEQAEKNAIIDQLNRTQNKLLSEQAEKNVIIDQLSSTQNKFVSEQEEKNAIIDQLNRTQHQLQFDLQAVKGHTTPAIAFSAGLTVGLVVSISTQVLAFPNVSLNQGSAYNSSTGKFTAPVSGVYYFSAFFSASFPRYATLYLTSASGYLFRSVASSDRQYQSASMQAAVHLKRGEQVWLSSESNNDFQGNLYTAFSGFLLSVD